MIRDQVELVHAAVTARLLWSPVEVAGLFLVTDDPDDVALHIDLLVDVVAEVAVAQMLRMVIDAPTSDAYTNTDMRRFIDRVGDALAQRRRPHLKAKHLLATRSAGLDACAAVIGAVGTGWWTTRLRLRALSAA
ncbi:MAG TPA: hypothetical protein VHD87_15000 [Acidimicrobiales bacterium]|nr:hypothetical protein [Acidimicrobiales bacterium]